MGCEKYVPFDSQPGNGHLKLSAEYLQLSSATIRAALLFNVISTGTSCMLSFLSLAFGDAFPLDLSLNLALPENHKNYKRNKCSYNILTTFFLCFFLLLLILISNFKNFNFVLKIIKHTPTIKVVQSSIFSSYIVSGDEMIMPVYSIKNILLKYGTKIL